MRAWAVGIAYGLAALTNTLLFIGAEGPVARAVFGMSSALFLLWCVGGGIVSRVALSQPRVLAWLHTGRPWLRFVVLAIAGALVEEAITVALTRSAPLFGVALGRAYVTASADYFDVVLFHSVVVFVGMFAVLGVAVARYEIAPLALAVTFGLMGAAGEALAFGLGSLLALPQWMLVYGLMVYGPAHVVPTHRARKPAGWWLFPAVFVLGLAAGALGATLAPWRLLDPEHPAIHFAPLAEAGPSR